MFGIPAEIFWGFVGIVATILANRFGIVLPLQKVPVDDPSTPDVDESKLPVKNDLETLVQQVVLNVLKTLFNKNQLPEVPKQHVETLLAELKK
jgi:hypothetical protein